MMDINEYSKRPRFKKGTLVECPICHGSYGACGAAEHIRSCERRSKLGDKPRIQGN